MRVTIGYEELTREARAALRVSPDMRRDLWAIVRRSAFGLERVIKERMPVDTGRAKASWGHSTAPASAPDGIWVEDEAALTIEEGSAVEYIALLNEGSSQQAPAGFIDVSAAVEEEILRQAIDDYLARRL